MSQTIGQDFVSGAQGARLGTFGEHQSLGMLLSLGGQTFKKCHL